MLDNNINDVYENTNFHVKHSMLVNNKHNQESVITMRWNTVTSSSTKNYKTRNRIVIWNKWMNTFFVRWKKCIHWVVVHSLGRVCYGIILSIKSNSSTWWGCQAKHSCHRRGRLKWDDNVVKWKHFPRYWPFVRGSHRWISLTKASDAELWYFFDLRLNKPLSKHSTRDVGDLKCHRAHHDVTIIWQTASQIPTNDCWFYSSFRTGKNTITLHIYWYVMIDIYIYIHFIKVKIYQMLEACIIKCG